MNSLIKGIERDYMIIGSIFSLFIIGASLTNFAYSQPSQMISNSSNEDKTNANSVNTQDIPTKKLHVGDILHTRPLVRVTLFC
jgi:cation transport ATPase